MHTAVKPAELTLKNGADSVRIRPRPATAGNPVVCRTWDLGSPDVRFMSTPNPGADGVTESVGYLGSRQVTFELQILGGEDPETGAVHDAYYYVNKLVRMTHPWAKPVLEVTRNDETTHDEMWRMVLRASPFTLTYGRQSAAVVELQLSFVCPLGLLESQLKQLMAPPPNVGARTDWAFPATFRKGFGIVGSQYPIMTIAVGGDAAIQPCIYLFGPGVNPDMRSGEDRFKFDGLTLNIGDSVKIDMATGDIVLNRGSATGAIPDDMSAYALVDWSVSTYWTWLPGLHQIILYSTTVTATVEFSERRLTI